MKRKTQELCVKADLVKGHPKRQVRESGVKGRLCRARQTGERAMPAVDVTPGQCAKVQGAPTTGCVRGGCNALLSGRERWVLVRWDPTGN